MIRQKRTNFDFSKHVHRVEIFKSQDGNEIRVDHFQIGDSSTEYIKFVNDSRGMAVFGDYGNWIFSRQFHPSANNYVLDANWAEKLKMHSCQESATYDSKRTADEIQELIDHGLQDYGYKCADLKKKKAALKSLKGYTDDEIEYRYEAYRNQSEIDFEMIPFCKTRSPQLVIIFDAFDEICNRLEKNS